MFIKNYDALAKTTERKIVLDLIEAAIESIQPEKVLSPLFRVQGSQLKINPSASSGQTLNLNDSERIFLIGFGKGSARISKIIEQKLGDFLTKGYVIDVTSEQFTKIEFTQGTHPLPSQTNIDFTKNVVEKLSNLTEKDLVLAVVTGGGSALFELPISLSTDELISVYGDLLKSGKNIKDLNKIRTQLSKVKGGGLAQILSPAKVFGLIFSDVPGNDLSVISSGPTVKDLPNVINILMLSNVTALKAMSRKATELGIENLIYFDALQGEAKNVGSELVKVTQEHSVLLSGGETTVTVQNVNGKGGRNQELVLGALSNATIEQLNNVVIASFDSDGWDNTEFAGAIGDSLTVQKAKSMNLNLQEFLDNNNSFEFFQKTGDGIITGRLPSNVSDLMIVYKK